MGNSDNGKDDSPKTTMGNSNVAENALHVTIEVESRQRWCCFICGLAIGAFLSALAFVPLVFSAEKTISYVDVFFVVVSMAYISILLIIILWFLRIIHNEQKAESMWHVILGQLNCLWASDKNISNKHLSIFSETLGKFMEFTQSHPLWRESEE